MICEQCSKIQPMIVRLQTLGHMYTNVCVYIYIYIHSIFMHVQIRYIYIYIYIYIYTYVIGMQVTDTLMLHPLYSFARMPRMAQGHTFTTWPRTPPDVLLLRKISECAVLLWEELYH